MVLSRLFLDPVPDIPLHEQEDVKGKGSLRPSLGTAFSVASALEEQVRIREFWSSSMLGPTALVAPLQVQGILELMTSAQAKDEAWCAAHARLGLTGRE